MKDRSVDSEFYFTFNAFNKELEKTCRQPCLYHRTSKIEYVWQEVKRTFQTFEEWYEDRTLYHYIGFLIEYGADIKRAYEKVSGNEQDGILDGLHKGKQTQRTYERN